jgi:hypothetical protein
VHNQAKALDHTSNGFSVLEACFNNQLTESIREASCHLLEQQLNNSSSWINAPHASSSVIHQAILHEPMLNAIENWIGPDFVCWGSSLLCKWPHSPCRVNWHQDAGYWPLHPAATVTAWIALDDATPQNGCLAVVPGSHSDGALPFEELTPTEHSFGFDSRCVKETSFKAAPLELPLKAGSVILFSDQLVHGSGPNQSDQRRLALVARYAPVHVRASNGWNHNAILCRGTDPSGHWTHRNNP